MPFVLDASVTMSWCFLDERSPKSESVLRELLDTHAEVPALWPFEVANALAAGIRRGRLDAAAADVFLRRLESLSIQVEVRAQPISGKDLMPLVLRHGLTAYDAAYLELARRKAYALATLDRHLIAAAPLEGVRLMGSPV